MKNFYLFKTFALSFIFISMFSLTSMAQPAFTSADMPNIGDADTVLIFSINDLQHDLDTETGNGYIWDFNEIPVSSYSMFINVDSYHEKQHDMAEYFQDATIERTTGGTNGSHLGYYKYRNDTLVMYKYNAPSASGWFPPIELMAFPLEFEESSDITSDFYYGDLKTGERRAIASYDGFGTLKINNNTFSDVYRIKTVETDTTFATQGSITYINYYWYKRGGQIPLLQLTYGNSPDFYYIRVSKAKGSSTGTNELKELAGFNMYPNPSSNYLNIEINHPEKVLTINIINPMGQAVRTYNDYMGHINISDLPKGSYFIQLTTMNEVVTKTFLKE